MTEHKENWKDIENTVLRRLLRAERERSKALADIIESLRWDLDKIFDDLSKQSVEKSLRTLKGVLAAQTPDVEAWEKIDETLGVGGEDDGHDE